MSAMYIRRHKMCSLETVKSVDKSKICFSFVDLLQANYVGLVQVPRSVSVKCDTVNIFFNV